MKKIFYTILLLVAFSSCQHYLDLKGNNSRAVPVQLDDLQALLNDAVRMNQERTPTMVENWSDDYFMLPGNFAALDDKGRRIYLWDILIYNHPNDWSNGYQPIYNANYCLEGLQKIGRNSENGETYDKVKGAALFYRSYYFQQLLWAFSPAYDAETASSELGIVLKEDTDFNTPSVRSSVQDGYYKVITDAEAALPLLPAVAAVSTQPSQAAVHGLLARAYLSMRLYEKAGYHASEALKLKSDLMDYNKTSDGVFLTRTQTFDRYNREVIFHSDMNSSQAAFYNGGRGGRVDSNLVLTYQDTDLRKQAFLRATQGYYQFKGSYSNSRFFSGIASDELYLIKAECLAREEKVVDAMQVLNHLLSYRFNRNSVFVPLTADSKAAALQIILLERRKTLLFRGLRLTDIKRLNKEGYQIIVTRKVDGQLYQLLPNDKRALVPIPTDLVSFIQ
ncbi:SusD family protein [Sphingobacterium nematocida]|uniref:SusD family protein n=1 Tax=Sphingobacterium nematocida TaxID=1513896 RepID=A0A1T5EKI5_9SPHI|nr:RagB/SusD family nutrient uptake outer membrane protein [Sphingobacterium nematocida]SKB84523.1 SusD family protein [Sphingobacterium nematocida]